MTFNSSLFLILFLPFCILLNYFINFRIRKLFLLAVSIIFYAWCGIQFLCIILISSIFAYFVGIGINHFSQNKSIALKRFTYIFAVFIHVAVLFRFKYLYDFLTYLNNFFRFICVDLTFTTEKILLPLGISFYTFSIISYETDVFVGNSLPQKNIVNVLLYFLFFPKVVQGPVMLYSDFERQLENNKLNLSDINDGLELFIIGLSKKMLIANNLENLVAYSFNDVVHAGTVAAWLGIAGYLLQLYYDFSGYSDMALGIGRMCGYSLPQNFNHPYMARTVAEYWRRWHITLGEWFKTYIYIPVMKSLVGSSGFSKMKNPAVTADIIALLCVWFITGIWHGSKIQFLMHGMWYFCFIAFERLRDNRRKVLRKQKKLPKRDTRVQIVTDHFITAIAIIFGQVIFRADGIVTIFNYWKKMFVFSNADGCKYLSQLNNLTIFALVVGIVFCFPVFDFVKQMNFTKRLFCVFLYKVMLVILFLISFLFVVGNGYTTFLYQVF